MKFVFAPVVALGAAATLLAAQAPASQTAPQSNSPQLQQPSTPEPTSGKVIFSRSTDENGATTTTAGSEASLATDVKAPTADDTERDAVTFTAYDLDVHLQPAESKIAVRAVLTLRNDGKTPLAHIPLEISSTLTWERIHLGGKDVPFTVATLNSDTDHTGQLHEAAVTLAEPLAVGATIEVDATYSGTITQNAQRLIALGTPDDMAHRSDWDEIGLDFTGLRGLGNVAWYPVAAEPVILGDGARLFDEVGQQKLRCENARFRLRLSDEFPHGQAPTIALVNGQSVKLNVVDPPNAQAEILGVATVDTGETTLGFTAPSLFVAIRAAHQAANPTLWTVAGDESNAQDWAAAATAISPFLAGWLGAQPRSELTILDLPDLGDAPFETGALLVTPIRADSADQLDGALAHALTHAWITGAGQPATEWLDEGVAHLMGTLWLEKQSGRARALESLESGRAALALDEPPSPGESTGQPLSQAWSPAYYRTKAAYVLLMLRDMVGDGALLSALRGYYAALSASAGPPASFEKLLETASNKDLKWFFADWVDSDKGLPDIAIDAVSLEPAAAGNTLVAVDISNSGYSGAEVPVTVSGMGGSVSKRVMVPGRGKITVRILLIGRPAQVQVNDGSVPETEATVHMRDLTGSSGSSQQQPDASPHY